MAALWAALPAPPVETTPLTRAGKILIIVFIFSIALLTRYFHHLDLAPLIKKGQQDFAGITAIHEGVAANIINKGWRAIFPEKWPPSDGSLIQYPPGYGLILSVIYSLQGRDPSNVQIVQGLLDAIAAVLVFLIALELYSRGVAIVAGLAAAISHHLAYYSMLLLPDGLLPVLVLAGTLFIIRGIKIGWGKNKGYRDLIIAGICFGLSCWLRSDGMLLWLFWAAIFFLMRSYLVEPAKRAITVALAMVAVIAPLTIRNYYIYGEFIPVSLGSGIVLLEGVAEADATLGLPDKDDKAMQWEAKFYHRPDYAESLMNPDGILREHDRRDRAMKIIITRPFWYLGVMAERVNLMMKYSAHASLVRMELPNDSGLGRSLSAFQAKQGKFDGLLAYYREYGAAGDFLRPILRALQRGFKESLFIMLIIGIICGLKNMRWWLLVMTVPCYYIFMHSLAHTEFRYSLPAHYLFFIFYGLAFHTIFIALPRLIKDYFRPPAFAGAIESSPFEQLSAQASRRGGYSPEEFNKYEPNSVKAIDEATQSASAAKMAREGVACEPPFPRQRIRMTGINVDNISQQETLDLIEYYIARRQPSMMAVVNASKLTLAQQDAELKQILLAADIVTADGMSVVWAAQLLGSPLKERVTGIDTFERLLEISAQKNYAVYLLGAKPEVVESIAQQLSEKFPQLKIAGYHNGYFGENENVLANIKSVAPDILFVAMGSPRQEKWIATNLANLNVPFTVGVGGSFDHVAGYARRAPAWMQRAGLEWLHRFISEPRRLWRRYIIGNANFLYLILKEKFQTGIRD